MQQHHDHQAQQSQHHPRQHHSQHHQQQQHQMIPPHQQMHSVHHQSLSHSQHLQASHGQMPHHQPHIHHHQSPHNQHILHSQQPQHQHMQHIQHPVYDNMLPTDIGYQQYPTSMEAPTMLQQDIEPQKQLHFSPYNDPDIEPSKPYRMPPELPYIKSPGMNRKDIKYLESAEDKENAIVVDYNGPLEENMVPKLDENNLYIDESLGITPLSTINETCYTEAFNTHLTTSTPMTNHFKPSYRMKDDLQFPNQNAIQP